MVQQSNSILQMRIVTKRGDKGTTRTLSGGMVSKSSREIEFVGVLDELQSFLGIIENRTHEIEEIQYDLYKIMGNERVEVERIDGYIKSLVIPDLTGFVLPKGYTHVARAVCRRAERVAVELEHPSVQYLNRLSDYLYILTFQ